MPVQVEHFVNGNDMQPELREESAAFAMAMTVERKVEGKHSVVKRHCCIWFGYGVRLFDGLRRCFDVFFK